MKKNNNPTFLQELRRELSEIWGLATFSISSSGIILRNWLRRLRRLRLDFVIIPVGGPLPERAGPPRSFIQRQLPLPPVPMSMELLNEQLTRISEAKNIYGVIFLFRGFSAGMATLSNFRRSVERLQAAGKKVVVFTPYLDLSHYYAATAADLIIVPPSAKFEMLGIRSEVMFLKDAIDRLGIQADVVQISPYKSAYDAFIRSDISQEQKAQIDWILDDTYETLIQAMAGGRQMEPEKLTSLIDRAPINPEDALENKLVDYLAYEDALPFILPDAFSQANKEAVDGSDEISEEDSRLEEDAEKAPPSRKRKATIANWRRARKILFETARRSTKKYIGVISVEGVIFMGQSRKPPIDLPIPIPMLSGEAAGESTITDLLRRAERDPQLAALILLIDSPGGLALASDLIWRQVFRLSQKKPVLAYMSNVAASGGYYIAAPAQHIMCQPTTVTGSIGVLAAHFSTRELFGKLSINRVVMGRGKNVQMLSDADPLSEDQLQILWSSLLHSYDQFKKVVADGRDLPIEDLDNISNGRVWTGSQAIEHKLVDSHGDFQDAVIKAAELAGIEIDDIQKIPVLNIYSGGDGYISPQPLEPLQELLNEFSMERLAKLNGKSLTIMPFDLRIH